MRGSEMEWDQVVFQAMCEATFGFGPLVSLEMYEITCSTATMSGIMDNLLAMIQPGELKEITLEDLKGMELD